MCDANRRVSVHHFANAYFADRISLIFKWDFPNLNHAVRINLRSIRKASQIRAPSTLRAGFLPFAALRWPSAPPRAPIGGLPLRSRCSPIAVPTYVSAPPGSQTTPSMCAQAIYSSDPGGMAPGVLGPKTRDRIALRRERGCQLASLCRFVCWGKRPVAICTKLNGECQRGSAPL